jgi:hypothetical protein
MWAISLVLISVSESVSFFFDTSQRGIVSKKKAPRALLPAVLSQNLWRLLILVELLAFVGFSVVIFLAVSNTLMRVIWLLIALSALPALTKELVKDWSYRLWKHRLINVGILAYRDNTLLAECLFDVAPVDATHLRPFVVLDMPQPDQVVIGFNLLSSENKGRLQYKARYQLRPGYNLLAPPDWAQLENPQIGEGWTLKVSINDRRMAIQRLSLQAGQAHFSLGADGEINEALGRAVDDRRNEGLSLRELLDDLPAIDAEHVQQP